MGMTADQLREQKAQLERDLADAEAAEATAAAAAVETAEPVAPPPPPPPPPTADGLAARREARAKADEAARERTDRLVGQLADTADAVVEPVSLELTHQEDAVVAAHLRSAARLPAPVAVPAAGTAGTPRPSIAQRLEALENAGFVKADALNDQCAKLQSGLVVRIEAAAKVAADAQVALRQELSRAIADSCSKTEAEASINMACDGMRKQFDQLKAEVDHHMADFRAQIGL